MEAASASVDISFKVVVWDTSRWILQRFPMNNVEQALRSEIDRRERELNALRAALAALAGGEAPARGRMPGRPAKAAKPAGKGKRRPKTAAEKKVLSEKLKAAWKRRQAAAKKSEKADKAAE